MYAVSYELYTGENCVIIFKTWEEARRFVDETQLKIDNGKYDEGAWISEPESVEFGTPISAYCG